MKINNFQGELTNISAKKEPLIRVCTYVYVYETTVSKLDIGNSKTYLRIKISKYTSTRSKYPKNILLLLFTLENKSPEAVHAYSRSSSHGMFLEVHITCVWDTLVAVDVLLCTMYR